MEWVDVNDRLPVNYKDTKGHQCIEVILNVGGKVEFAEFNCGPRPVPWYEFEGFHKAYVTHWMEKPEPPKT